MAERPVRRPGTGRAAKAAGDAPIGGLEIEEARHRHAQAQAFRIGGEQARDDRLGDAVQHLAPEPPADERREALVIARGGSPSDERLAGHAQLPAPGEKRRSQHRPQARRGHHEEPLRHAMEPPAVEDLRPRRVAAELAKLGAEPDPLAERDARRLLRHERVGPSFEEELP